MKGNRQTNKQTNKEDLTWFIPLRDDRVSNTPWGSCRKSDSRTGNPRQSLKSLRGVLREAGDESRIPAVVLQEVNC